MIGKEFRALLPMWLAVVAAMVGARQLGRGFEFLGAPAFFIGSAALGAMSFGQEYTYRTVGLLLTLPVSRNRIWASKLLLLLAFVTSLAILAFYLQAFGNASAAPGRVLVLTVLAAVGLAPWLAMLSRSALGGTVFAVSIPGMLFVASQVIGQQVYGYVQQADHFIVTSTTVTMVSLSALGLLLGWRTFAGLEAIEGHGAEVALLPSSGAVSAVSPGRRSHPMWLLVKKELHLQQMPWVLAAIYVALYVTIVFFTRDTSYVDNSITILTLLYTAVMAMMIGALAGGEERQLGVHDAQLLLPISSRRQWMIKIATSLALGALLTIVLPLILVTVLPPEAIRVIGRRGLIQPGTVMMLASLVTLGLYVSVVAGSGVRGLLASIPIGMTMFYIYLQFILPLMVVVVRYARTGTTDRVISYERVLPKNADPYAIALLFGLFLVVVLRLGLTNYRWSDRPPLRLARHTAIALAALTLCFGLLAAIGIR